MIVLQVRPTAPQDVCSRQSHSSTIIQEHRRKMLVSILNLICYLKSMLMFLKKKSLTDCFPFLVLGTPRREFLYETLY